MGTLANSLFQILLGWTRTLSAEIWNTFSSPDGTTLLSWLGEHWKGLALLMCAAGLAVDLIVYLFRWQPYRVWRSRHRGSREDDDENADTEEMPFEPGTEEIPEPVRQIKKENQWENRRESIPEKGDLRMNTGERRSDAGADFREETDLSGDEQDPPYPEAEEIPAQEENEDPWKAYRRPAERYIRNAYDADSEEEQLAAWRQPEERDLPAEEEERVTE